MRIGIADVNPPECLSQDFRFIREVSFGQNDKGYLILAYLEYCIFYKQWNQLPEQLCDIINSQPYTQLSYIVLNKRVDLLDELSADINFISILELLGSQLFENFAKSLNVIPFEYADYLKLLGFYTHENVTLITFNSAKQFNVNRQNSPNLNYDLFFCIFENQQGFYILYPRFDYDADQMCNKLISKSKESFNKGRAQFSETLPGTRYNEPFDLFIKQDNDVKSMPFDSSRNFIKPTYSETSLSGMNKLTDEKKKKISLENRVENLNIHTIYQNDYIPKPIKKFVKKIIKDPKLGRLQNSKEQSNSDCTLCHKATNYENSFCTEKGLTICVKCTLKDNYYSRLPFFQRTDSIKQHYFKLKCCNKCLPNIRIRKEDGELFHLKC